MAKTKRPFLSMGASGTVGGVLTAQKRGRASILRSTPVPTDPYTLAQAYHRWDYRDYAYLWTLQTESVKQSYRTRGSRYHLTGFSLWMREHLKELTHLVARYHFDEATGVLAFDSSRNSNTGTATGTSIVPGRFSNARYFDGIDDIIVAPDHSSLRIITAVSFEVIANLDTNIQRPFLMKPYAASARNANYAFLTETVGRLQVAFGDDVNYRLKYTNLAVPSGVHHLAGVIASATDMRLYFDGVYQAGIYDGTATQLTALPGDLRMGHFAGWRLAGWIDELRIYEGVLDPQLIKYHSERRYP